MDVGNVRRRVCACAPPSHPHPTQDDDKIRADAVSHHILRLAYAGSEEKRRWFREQETALFKYRLEAESPEQLADFMLRNQLKFVQVGVF